MKNEQHKCLFKYILLCESYYGVTVRGKEVNNEALFFVHIRYELPVTATADNCLLSCYPFLAAHQTDFHIICRQQGISILDKQTDTQDLPPGEPLFMPCVTPNRPPTIASTNATSTSFGISTSTYPESSNEATSSTYPSTPHHGESQQGGATRVASDGSDGNGTFVLVSGVESEERKFIRKVVTAVQRCGKLYTCCAPLLCESLICESLIMLF